MVLVVFQWSIIGKYGHILIFWFGSPGCCALCWKVPLSL